MRVAVLFLIITAFWGAIFLHFKIPQKAVLGVKTSLEKDSVDSEKLQLVEKEIADTKKVLEARPDYAAAWIKLGTLYESIGKYDLAREAREKAKGLNFFGD